jgi:hypothetical protein
MLACNHRVSWAGKKRVAVKKKGIVKDSTLLSDQIENASDLSFLA